MKTLNAKEISAVAGAVNYANAAQAFFSGASLGGILGTIIPAAAGQGLNLQTVATWAVSGGLVTSLLRD